MTAVKKRSKSDKSGLQDRILRLERIRVGNLESHPLNPRQHPAEQIQALNGILSEVGIADAVLGFPADGKGKDGDFSQLMIFDGHARKEINPDQIWPILVTDLTREEADKMLLVLDPIASLATNDQDLLESLIASVSIEDDSLKSLIQNLVEENALGELGKEPTSPDEFKEVGDDIEVNCTCPRCGYQWSDGTAK